jgi:hypothetical protein
VEAEIMRRMSGKNTLRKLRKEGGVAKNAAGEAGRQ